VKRGLTDTALFAGFFLLLSGMWLSTGIGGESAAQIVLVLHVMAGLALLVPLIAGTVSHVRTRLLLRPDSMDMAARLNGIVLALVVLTGLGLMQGLFYYSALIPPLSVAHLVTAIALVPITLWHVRAALRRHAGRRQPGSVEGRRGLPHLGISLLVLLVGVGGGMLLDASRSDVGIAPTDVSPGASPFRPSRALTHGNQLLDASLLERSEECGTCHTAIYEQWAESMHRASATDPHVATGIDWFRRDNGIEASRACAGCHSPIPLLAGELEPESKEMTDRSPAHEEGVSCLLCHSIDNIAREGPGNASYRIKTPSRSILGSGAAAGAMQRLTGSAHSEAMMRPLMQDPLFCASCHQQLPTTAKEEALSGQFDEWSRSHYSEQGSESYKSCQDCHMPLIEANDPAAKDGKVHSHRFVGSNHAHAVSAGLEEQARLVLENLQGALTMDLRVAAIQNRAEHLIVEVFVTNTGSGHHFPTGVTDIKEAWIELVATSSGKQLFGSGLLDAEHYLDKDAHSWRKVLLDHRNMPVDLHNVAVVKKTLFERSIRPSQTDVARYEIPLREVRQGTVQLQARLRMRRANQRWNDWLFNFDGRTVPVVDIHLRQLEVDLPLTISPAKTPLTPINATGPTPTVPDGMVYIPGGSSLLGDALGEPDEQPPQRIDLDGFAIDRYPITNAQYQQFLVAQDMSGPELKLPWADKYNWQGSTFPAGSDQRPTVLVTRDEAAAYCAWRGDMRLPSEAEWEKAARGPSENRYPWGDDWQAGHCEEVEGMDVPARVGMCPQRDSGYGISDLVGGVFEWTADSYSAYDRTFLHPNANEWLVTFDPLMYSVRGSPPGQVGPATASYSRSGQNGYQRGRVGFRCVKKDTAL
jgi:formylglycine-generating enzyme required for sulfatase activity